MSWDYGVRAQVEEEYRDALAAGYCHLCAAHKPDVEGQPCHHCQEDLDVAAYEMERME